MKTTYLYILIVALLQATSLLPATSQTVIELDKGGAVRSKNLRDYDKAVSLEQAQMDSIKYVDHITRGFNALHDDSLRLAQSHFEAALKLRPNAPGNHIVKQQIAKIAEAEGRFADAANLYTQILKQQPDLHAIRIERAALNLQLRHFKESKEDCDVLLQQTSTSIDAERLYFIRASANIGLRLNDDAQRDFEHVLKLNPRHESAPIMLALLLHDEGQANKALTLLNLHLQAHPENVEALMLRASFEMKQSRYEAARADLDKAISLAPDEPALYLERANCFDKLKNKERARRDRLKAHTLKTLHPAHR